METWEREYLVSRIISSSIPIILRNKTLLLKTPTVDVMAVANAIFVQTYKEAQLEGLYMSDQLEYFLHSKKIWTLDDQVEADKLENEIEKSKVALFELYTRSIERELARKNLAVQKKRFEDMLNRKHAYDYLTCNYVAFMAKQYHLVGSSLYYSDGSRYEDSGEDLDVIIQKYVKEKTTDVQLRELSHQEPWQSYWVAADKCGNNIFGKPAIELSDEQRTLIRWSVIYDNIHKHPDCPPESVLEDDDALDGWSIIQRRKRKKEIANSLFNDKVKNSKIKNSEEIFLFADTKEDAEEIVEMNDAVGARLMRERMDMVKRNKVVNHAEFKDVQLDIKAQVAQKYAERFRK